MAFVNPVTCSKCGGRMVEGGILNKDSNGASALVSWIQGRPARSIWTGLKTKGYDKYPVTSFRCNRCGFLETYANDLKTR